MKQKTALGLSVTIFSPVQVCTALWYNGHRTKEKFPVNVCLETARVCFRVWYLSA